jgi:hypothetical protein
MASYKNIFFKILALLIIIPLLVIFSGCRQNKATDIKAGKEIAPEAETNASLFAAIVEDTYPNGCVDCHKKVSDEKDYRLNVLLAKEGKHPDITEIVNSIPDDCMNCHTEGSENSIGNIAHRKHYENPEENTFISEYQGSCFNCHSMDIEEGKVVVKSLTIEEQSASLNDHVDLTKMDCTTCHQKLSVSVNQNSWDHSSLGQMKCTTCHQNLNVTVDNSSWDHSSLTKMDCTTCHQKLSVSVNQNSWDHSSLGQMDCTTCHQNLNVSVDNSSWDHSSLNQMDCTTCHQKLNVSVDKNSWDHSDIDCNSCHEKGHGEDEDDD